MEKILQEIGLNETEIKIYMTLLKIGESKSGEIIKEGGIKSGRLYEFFDSLTEKGLISYNTRSGIRYFIATDPKNLYSYLDKKKEKILSLKDKLKIIIPEITANKKYIKRSMVEVYEGIEGFKNAFSQEIKFKENEELLCFGVDPIKTYNKEIVDHYIYNLFKLREKFKIRKLFSENSRGENTLFEEKSENKYIQDDSLATIDLIGDLSLIHLHYGKDIIISIKDKEFAESLKDQFDLIWKNAKK